MILNIDREDGILGGNPESLRIPAKILRRKYCIKLVDRSHGVQRSKDVDQRSASSTITIRDARFALVRH